MTIHDRLDEIRESFALMEKELTQKSESVWESLSEDQQLDVFCAVVRRLVKGELEEGRSYRGVLYDTFGFGTEAYMQAQLAGFLGLHNSICSESDFTRILSDFVQFHTLDVTEEQIEQFMLKSYL